MIKLLILLSPLFASCMTQYFPNNYQQQPPPQYDSGQYNPNAQYQSHPQPQHQRQPQYSFPNSAPTTTTPGPLHPPAQVHYVNIGPELAGDYKFGYDTGKGPAGQSFREEVRLPDGTVKGAYGYIDAEGKMRIVKYTAGIEGFKVDSDAPADAQPSSAPQAQQPRPRPAPAPQSQPQYAPPPPQPAPRPVQQYAPPRQAQPVPLRQTSPPAIPAHSLEQLQAFNRPPPQAQPAAPVRPYYGHGQAGPQAQPQYQAQARPQAQPQYNYNALPRAQAGFGGASNKVEEEEVTYGPPVIPVELLNYNIGVGK